MIKWILMQIWNLVAWFMINTAKLLLFIATKGTIKTIEVTAKGVLKVGKATTTRKG